MALVNPSGMSVAWMAGRVPPHRLSITVLVKGTFRLRDGGPAVLAPEQLPPCGDVYEDAGTLRGYRYANDFVPVKPKADVCLVGNCYAPGGAPTDVSRTTFVVGAWSKSLAVIGNRSMKKGFFGPKVTQPEPWTVMPLTYENAYGGPDYAMNPWGKGHRSETTSGKSEHRSFPNLEPILERTISLSAQYLPACYRPVPPSFPQRGRKFGTYDADWLKKDWPWPPDDFDATYYNAAPFDAQLQAYLKGDEKLVFENLHKDLPLYQSRLPGLRVRWFTLQRVGTQGKFREIPLHLDTLWVDLDAETLVLVWRGVAAAHHPRLRDFRDHIVVSEPLASQPKPGEEYVGLVPKRKGETAILEAPPVAETTAVPDPVQELWKRLQAEHPAIAAKLGPPPVPEPPPAPAPWTRESAAGAGGELAGADLSKLDLSGLDLTGASLAKASLAGANLRGAILVTADLSEANLEGADLRDAKLDRADVSKARLAGAKLAGASAACAWFWEADLSGVDATGAKLAGAVLDGCALAGAVLKGADLSDASAAGAKGEGIDAEGADLSRFKASPGAELPRSNFRAIRAEKSVWAEAKLDGGDFTGASLPGANFTLAALRRAIFLECDLRGARLAESRLEGADFAKTNLFRADFEAAQLEGTRFLGCNLFEAEFYLADATRAKFEACDLGGTKLEKKVVLDDSMIPR
jgi:uncharacterized protein YjbI with pentapeptide repeats